MRKITDEELRGLATRCFMEPVREMAKELLEFRENSAKNKNESCLKCLTELDDLDRQNILKELSGVTK